MQNISQLFAADSHGRKYRDVTESNGIPWRSVIQFFENDDRDREMIFTQSELNLPALAGVIKRFELLPEISEYFNNTDSHKTQRFHQAVGVLVRIVMEQHGWKTAARPNGPLGTRLKVSAGTTSPGAYKNSGGLSKWFASAKHYERNNPST